MCVCVCARACVCVCAVSQASGAEHPGPSQEEVVQVVTTKETQACPPGGPGVYVHQATGTQVNSDAGWACPLHDWGHTDQTLQSR